MFEIRIWSQKNNNHYIKDEHNNYLHSDGSVYPCAAEYWPTQEVAQIILDKFQPKHVWEHGDVFECKEEIEGAIMIYMGAKYDKPQVFYLLHSVYSDLHATLPACRYLKNAKFLFNIRSKL